MKRQIIVSKRLNTVIGLVEPGKRFADVGTDHGFVPISLVQRGICPGGLAMDVRSGPLQRANDHIAECGLTDRIETRLGDGFAAMRPGEAQVGIIAGMGGPLMIRIMEEGAEQVHSLQELVLSPQSEIAEVRAYIRNQNFRIVQEVMLEEEGKYYVVMKVRVGEPAAAAEHGWEIAEDLYGAYLLQNRDAVLAEYLEKETAKLQILAENLKESPMEENRKQVRLQEIAAQIAQIKEIKEHYYEMQ